MRKYEKDIEAELAKRLEVYLSDKSKVNYLKLADFTVNTYEVIVKEFLLAGYTVQHTNLVKYTPKVLKPQRLRNFKTGEFRDYPERKTVRAKVSGAFIQDYRNGKID